MELLLPVLSFACVVLLLYGGRLAMGARPQTVGARLERYARPATNQGQSAWSIARTRQRLSSIAGVERLLSRGGYAERVAVELARAGVSLRVGEYVLIRWGLAAGLFFLATSFTGILPVGLLAGLGGYFLPRLYVSYKRGQRRVRLEAQLVEALSVMAGTLRAGHSFLQALESVRRETAAPLGEEVRLVLEDIAVGARVEDALESLVERCESEEIDMAVTAMLIQRSTGGNLTEVMDNLASTIRDRIRIRREIQTLTAQERYSSYIVGIMPVAMFALISAINPSYLNALFGTAFGQIMLVGAAILSLIGFLIIQKIMAIEV